MAGLIIGEPDQAQSERREKERKVKKEAKPARNKFVLTTTAIQSRA